MESGFLSASEDCGHDAGIPTSVQHSNHPQGFFIGRVGNEVFTYKSEPQGPRTEVRALMALMWKRHKRANAVKNLRHDPVGCVRASLCNVIAYVVEVGEGFRVERVAVVHAWRLRCASVFALRRAKAPWPSMGLTLPLFSSS